MKRGKPNNYKKILKAFEELHEMYPSQTIGQHISTIMDGYKDVWGVSDKEFLLAISNYKAQLQLDVPRETKGEEEIEKIVYEGLHLESIDLTPEDYDE
jgi:hypothetical protein